MRWCYFGGRGRRGEIPGGLHWRPGGQAARAQGRVMGACFGSSSVCTEQYSVWAPTSAPGSASATLPARLLVTSIEPTRQTPNSPAREGSFKQKVPKFGPEQNSPCRFWFKIGPFGSRTQFASFLTKFCFWSYTCCEVSEFYSCGEKGLIGNY